MVMVRLLLTPLRWLFPQIPPPIPPGAWCHPFDNDIEYVRVIDTDIEEAQTRWRGEGDQALHDLAEEDAAHVAEHGYTWS